MTDAESYPQRAFLCSYATLNGGALLLTVLQSITRQAQMLAYEKLFLATKWCTHLVLGNLLCRPEFLGTVDRFIACEHNILSNMNVVVWVSAQIPLQVYGKFKN